MRPEATANRHGREIGMPRVVRIFGHDASGFTGVVRRFRFRYDGRFLLENATNRCLADVNASAGERFGDLYFAERRTEQFDLLNWSFSVRIG